MLRGFHFIEHRDRIIGERDPAAPFAAHQQIILADAEFPGALALDKFGRWRQEGPVQIPLFTQVCEEFGTGAGLCLVSLRETFAIDHSSAIGQ
ncbi:hypothetical protein D3C80_764950 [compost metagenome]